MEDKVSLTYFLKDDYTQKLDKMASKTDVAVAKMNKGIGSVSGTSKKLVKSIDEIDTRLDKLAKQRRITVDSSVFKQITKEMEALEKAKQKLEGTSTSSGGGGLMSFIKPAIPALGAAAITGFLGDSINTAMEFGATSKSFEVLAGNAGKGRELAGTLNRLQQDTILGPEVFKAAQTMMSFGVATDKVVKIEKELGDVSMGNTEHFEALTLAFSQTQAAGKLMGQDLLQYINAGFNPLQTMSEHWKEFGLTSQKSVGELKEMMEKGMISSAAVSKSFEIATSKGGKFANMMDTIGETTYGKMKVLDGAWENMKIQIGNTLIPLAEGFMEAGGEVLGFLNISKSVPQQLADEKDEVGYLVGQITSLNEGNEKREELLQKLVTKYPDLFGKIDIEKEKNSELLAILQDVNKSYNDRISLAAANATLSDDKSAFKDNQSDIDRWSIALARFQKGDVAGANRTLSMGDKWLRNKFSDDTNDVLIPNFYKKLIADKQKENAGLDKFINNDKKDVANEDIHSKLPALIKKLQGKKTLTQEEQKALHDAVLFTKLPAMDTGSFLPNFIAKDEASSTVATPTEQYFTEGKAKKKKGSGSLDSDGINGVSGGIGVRNVNINIDNLIKEQNISTTTLNESRQQIKDLVTEVLLEAINDGNLAATR